MNSPVAAVESFMFLGTTISQDLKWDNHIESMVKKAQQRLYFLHQLREVQPATGAADSVLLCHHRVCPVFIYNCLVWFSYQNRHQKSTTDSQDCWEDYQCPSASKNFTPLEWGKGLGKSGNFKVKNTALSTQSFISSIWNVKCLLVLKIPSTVISLFILV